MIQNETESRVFTEVDGPVLVSACREIVSRFLDTRKRVMPSSLSQDPRFQQKMGCFVTLKKKDPEKTLRGCIGYPEPVYELRTALINSAIEAATRDPRFSPVKTSEFRNLILEISLLTGPVEIRVKNQKDLLSKIDIGKDGLIMRWAFGSGLLLPQVATEYGWGTEEFLCNLSMKAGASPDQWLIPGTMIYKFQALVFEERSPGGSVIMH
jgi:uncharacterized protein